MYGEMSQSCSDLAGDRSAASNEVTQNIISSYLPEISDADESKLRLISDLCNFFSTPPGQYIVSQVSLSTTILHL